MEETELMLLKDMDSDIFDYNEYLLIYKLSNNFIKFCKKKKKL